MKARAVNPYLPSWEYVPDAEPHIFGDRLYIYGSHDRAHGTTYCEEDYVGWSAPICDLGNWRYEGIIYRKDQDSGNQDGKKCMFAPDAAQGADGRYYLYYGLSDIQYISIAVSDSPSGPFEYYGKVTYADGSLPTGVAFDPGILVEGECVYLYYGFSPKMAPPVTGAYSIREDDISGAYMVRLAHDMKTILSEPVLIANGYVTAKGTSFEEHPFFEASSIRHIGEKYYFIYSSLQGHELCYALSDSPSGPFLYGGVIISNGDIGLEHGQMAYDANNHGGIVQINGQYYIFYHRHTHGTHFSRQGCAEKITILKNGHIPQVEITSCGLNDAALPANEEYPVHIICNLHGPKPACHIPSRPPYDEEVPYLWESEEAVRQNRSLYLKNMQKGAACGVKYLAFSGETEVFLVARGGSGSIKICLDHEKSEPAAIILVEEKSQNWKEYSAPLNSLTGDHAVYFCFETDSEPFEFLSFRFQ